jgi:hypothetical protein
MSYTNAGAVVLDREAVFLQSEGRVVKTLLISSHAIRRYRERVDPTASSARVACVTRDIIIKDCDWHAANSRPARAPI